VTETTPERRPKPDETSESAPESELTLVLWLVALLLIVLELAWWWFDRLYS
jgi:hypothetical protein